MPTEKYSKCRKCHEKIEVHKDPFIPALCRCGHMQITPFIMGGIQFQKLLASSPIFLLFYGIYEEKNLFVEITVLRKDISNYDFCLKVAEEQAEVSLNLRHLNICPIFEKKKIANYLCIISPALDGYSLASYLPEEHGLLATNKTIDLLQATALGMAVAHYKEIPHHNLCPENIHLDNRGILRIKNFFISRFIYIYDQKRIKKYNHIFTSVSPHYISPEKVESGAEDKRGDVFSFGVIFYYFLTGKFPFHGTGEFETVYTRSKLKHKAKQGKITTNYDVNIDKFPDYISPKKPSDIRPQIPKEISQLIIKTLSYYPNDRPTFSTIISEFNILRAKENAIKIRHAQEEIVDSETKSIPKMKPLFKGSKTLKKS